MVVSLMAIYSQDLSTEHSHWRNCTFESRWIFQAWYLYFPLKARLFLIEHLICLQDQFCHFQCLLILPTILVGAVSSSLMYHHHLLHHLNFVDMSIAAPRSKHASQWYKLHIFSKLSALPLQYRREVGQFHLLLPFHVVKGGGAPHTQWRKDTLSAAFQNSFQNHKQTIQRATQSLLTKPPKLLRSPVLLCFSFFWSI